MTRVTRAPALRANAPSRGGNHVILVPLSASSRNLKALGGVGQLDRHIGPACPHTKSPAMSMLGNTVLSRPAHEWFRGRGRLNDKCETRQDILICLCGGCKEEACRSGVQFMIRLRPRRLVYYAHSTGPLRGALKSRDPNPDMHFGVHCVPAGCGKGRFPTGVRITATGAGRTSYGRQGNHLGIEISPQRPREKGLAQGSVSEHLNRGCPGVALLNWQCRA
jgi:hypothetical protein